MSAAASEQLCINTIRTLSMDAVQKANSGHPGTAMALAPVVYTLWQHFLKFDPADPIWPNRDRFVLSIGHASMLLYSVLHLTGVKSVNPKYETLGEPSVSLDDIKAFRQWESDPGWVYVRGKYAGQHGGGPDGRAPGGLAALELQPAYRRRTPPPPGSPPATTQHWDGVEAALAPWKGRVIWVPSTVPRPQSERTADVCSAVLLTPATLVADVVWVPIMIPVLLLYSAGGHTC